MLSRCGSRYLLLFVVLMLLGSTGCSRTKPREHWWEFWRPKSVPTETAYHPDYHVLPPPPESVDPMISGESARLNPDSELPPPPVALEPADQPAETAPVREAAAPISELQIVYFDYDSSQLSDAARELLDLNAQWILNHPGYEIQIEGHCDERGTVEYNYNLGMQRAKTVRAYLISQGVEPERLHTISYGEERPLVAGAGEETYSRNRRVQFLVYGE